MVATGIAIAVLALAVAAMLLDDWRVSRSQPSPVSRPDRPVAVAGCFGCRLASEAGDAYLRQHLERECAA